MVVGKMFYRFWLPTLFLCFATFSANAQSFRVQCPTSTITHPDTTTTQLLNSSEPAYAGPTSLAVPATPPPGTKGGFLMPTANVNGAIKCQQISGGDGFATMGDGTQTYMFSFGPLSGIADIANGLPGTKSPTDFNMVYTGATPLLPGDPATTVDTSNCTNAACIQAALVSFGYNGAVGLAPETYTDSLGNSVTAMNGHVDPRQIMRPDLFEQHTVHFHGYPNASSFYDGVPDASVAINIGGSFTYYYLAPDAGTYFWHCHITPPEHLQMGMVGQLYVRPRQNRVSGNLYDGLVAQQADPRTACYPYGDTLHQNPDILCSSPLPASKGLATGGAKYAYNDGDGTTGYDVEYPIQIHGFDPSFHFVGMTFNPEQFTDMKDKFFLLNGRSYPDTVTPGAMQTQSADGASHFSQPLPTIINIPARGRALLRISDLDVTEYQTLASLGIPMHVIGINARLLRDLAGNDMTYYSNSITLAGGESIDVILDSCSQRGPAPGYACVTPIPKGTYYLYTPNLDHLSNDAENFGGLMTEVHIN